MPIVPDVVDTHAQVHLMAEKLDRRLATARKLVATWYPQINTLMFSPGHALPGPLPEVVVDATPIAEGVPAYAERGVIHLWADYIADQPEDDFEGMVIHELTHVNQNAFVYGSDSTWVVEGIADYIRHKHFAKDIETTLRMTPDGRLQGYTMHDPYFYSLQERRVDLRTQGFQASYTVASTFLRWLEVRSNARVVPELSRALEMGNYTPELFARLCGRSLDDLWADFMAESEKSRSSTVSPTDR